MTLPNADSKSLIAYVMVEHTNRPPSHLLHEAIRRRVPDFSGEANDAKPDEPVVGVVPGRGLVAIMWMPAPLPFAGDESCIKSAWWWPGIWDDLQRLRAHAMVSLSCNADPRDGYVLLAKLAAAVIETSAASAIFWEPADAVWQAGGFRQAVDEAGDELPIARFVSVKLAGDTEHPRPDGGAAWLAMTYGLKAFGLMEMETRGFEGEPADLIATMLNTSAYLIKSGAVIKDGDTIGPDERIKFTVRHAASTLAAGQNVYRIHFPHKSVH